MKCALLALFLCLSYESTPVNFLAITITLNKNKFRNSTFCCNTPHKQLYTFIVVSPGSFSSKVIGLLGSKIWQKIHLKPRFQCQIKHILKTPQVQFYFLRGVLQWNLSIKRTAPSGGHFSGNGLVSYKIFIINGETSM